MHVKLRNSSNLKSRHTDPCSHIKYKLLHSSTEINIAVCCTTWIWIARHETVTGERTDGKGRLHTYSFHFTLTRRSRGFSSLSFPCLHVLTWCPTPLPSLSSPTKTQDQLGSSSTNECKIKVHGINNKNKGKNVQCAMARVWMLSEKLRGTN